MLRISSLLLCTLVLFSAPIFGQDYTRIGLGLQDQLEAAPPEAFHPVNILLADRVDVRAMGIRFTEKNTPLEERAYEVITSLQAKAAATQGPVLAFLQAQAGVRSGSVSPLWITNLVQAELTEAAIAALSQRQDIEMIEYDFPPEEDETQREAAIAIPNGSENGLRAIHAPFMWNQGYTGYGRRAFIVDSGVDPAHDALKDKFWGNIVPKEEAWFSVNDPTDCDNHGTHVAGTVLGLNEADNDTIGVAFGGFWMGAPAIGCENVSTVAAFQWALDPDGDPTTIDDMPDVINNSWGFNSGNPASVCNGVWVSTLNATEAAGIAVVFSAGNNGAQGASSITAPKYINTDLVNSFCVGNLNGNVPSFPISGSSSRGPSACGGAGSLLIKPEVSAPGTSVRSSITGNGYALFSGTSMAAPHVSGAVLLLKEAFPYLSGTDIKLALYFSATDLGPMGEDDLYGMGIINLEAAYTYLVDAGNVPVVPDSTDMVHLQVYEENGFVVCDDKFEVELAFTYNGPGTISAAKIAYSLNNAGADTLDWSGTLQQGDTVHTTLLLSNLTPGDYDLKTTLLDEQGELEYFFANNNQQLFFSISTDPVVTNVVDSVCLARQSLLVSTAPAPYEVLWFNGLVDSFPFQTGGEILVPQVIQEQVYYTNAGFYGRTGINEWDPASGSYAANLNGVTLFDVHHPARLLTVKVYVNSPGPRAITLLNSAGGTLASTFVSLQPGEHVIELDFDLPIGTGYQLIASLNPGFFQQDDGATYPYELENLITITGNATQSAAYHYFYDWEVSYESACPRSTARSVPTSGSAFADFLVDGDTIFSASVPFSDASLLAESWLWDFGDGTTSTEQNPIHMYADTGVYEVSLQITGPEGCTDALIKTITVIPRPTAVDNWLIDEALTVYPNPGTGLFQVVLPTSASGVLQLQVLNQMGQLVAQTQLNANETKQTIDLSDQAAGVYLVQLIGEQQRYQARLLKQ
ncbi:MAG: S8 family serine peptidase [Bacteroidota bacterium]